MWFVKVNSDACDIEKLAEGLPVLMWAYHPIGKEAVPHYHFLLDYKYKRADSFNKNIRALLLNPQTRSLKSTLCDENYPEDPHSLDTVIAYMKRFINYTDVWEKATYYISPDLPDVAPGFLKPHEMKQYLLLKSLQGHLKTPPMTQEIVPQGPPLTELKYTVKIARKPTQRDLIQHVWDNVQLNIDSGYINKESKKALATFVYKNLTLKLRTEKLKYDKYQLIQMMTPIMCEFSDEYNTDLERTIVHHFLSL